MCRRGDHSSRSSFGASPICFDLSRAWVAGLVDAYSNKKHTTLKGTAPILLVEIGPPAFHLHAIFN